jgi:hypothetical protein
LLELFFADDFLVADFFFAGGFGTFFPAARASDNPIAIACFGFVTFLPLRPDFSLPRFISCISRSTDLLASGEYFLVLLFFLLLLFFVAAMLLPPSPNFEAEKCDRGCAWQQASAPFWSRIICFDENSGASEAEVLLLDLE